MVLSGPSASWSWNLVGKEGALAFLCFLFLSLSSSLPFFIVQMAWHGPHPPIYCPLRLPSMGPGFPFKFSESDSVVCHFETRVKSGGWSLLATSSSDSRGQGDEVTVQPPSARTLLELTRPGKLRWDRL